MNQYAIRREVTEFLGPLRCQACISRDNECVVNRESRSCSGCNSEAECLFERNVVRKESKKFFTWAELNGEIPTQRIPPRIQGSQQASGEVNALMTPEDHRRQYTPSRSASTSTSFLDKAHDPYLSASQPNNPAQLEHLAASRTSYDSSRLANEGDPVLSRSLYPSATNHRNEYPPLATTARAKSSTEDSWPNRYRSMHPSNQLNQLPSIRDSLSHLDPRITSDVSSSMLSSPSSRSDDFGQPMYSLEYSQHLQQGRMTYESEDSRSHDFVMETFNTVSGSMESRRGKRRGKLSESSATSANKLRSIGACWKCKLQKNQVGILTAELPVILANGILV